MKIPAIGIGTYQLTAQQTYHSVRLALDVGYRHIDTAALYRNEFSVGKAVRDSGIHRSTIMVTSKITNKDIRKKQLTCAIERSLSALDIGYIDLLLLHTPDHHISTTWNHFCDLCQHPYKATIHHIGVSNYQIAHLQQLAKSQCTPAVNQIEVSPFLPRQVLRRYCNNHEIQVIAHSSLTKGHQLNHPQLRHIIKHYFPERKITTASLLLGWALQQGIYILPRSSKSKHIIENYKVPTMPFSTELLAAMDALHCGFATHPQHLQ